MVAASLGNIDVINLMLKNPGLNLDMVDPKHGCNAFWYASFYGRTHIMRLLAEAGIDVLSKDKFTHANALHIAIQRQNHKIAKMLIESNFPMNCTMKGGITAFIIAAEDPNFFRICTLMMAAGADINMITENGDSALSQTVKGANMKFTEVLLKNHA